MASDEEWLRQAIAQDKRPRSVVAREARSSPDTIEKVLAGEQVRSDAFYKLLTYYQRRASGTAGLTDRDLIRDLLEEIRALRRELAERRQ